MAKNQIQMPSSTAGITQYYGEEEGFIRIKPTVVLFVVGAVAAVLLIAHLMVRLSGSGL